MKNKLQSYKFVFDNGIVKIKSYRNRVSATREASKLLKKLNQQLVKVFEIKGKEETQIKEIKNGI